MYVFFFCQQNSLGDAFTDFSSLCSAGVGRTGTFIGLDYLYDEGKANNHVNVYRCVEAMRKQRINMVQMKVIKFLLITVEMMKGLLEFESLYGEEIVNTSLALEEVEAKLNAF